MRTVLFQNFKKKDVESSHRGMPSRNRCSSNSILDFDNKLMEGTNFFCKCLEYISKRVRFYKAATLRSIMFTKRSISSEENFNGHAKILITHILYRNTTPEAYLEPSRPSTMELFLQKDANFFKNFPPQMLDWVLNIPLSSERLLQKCEYMTNLPSLMI